MTAATRESPEPVATALARLAAIAWQHPFPCTQDGGSTHASTARMLKSAPWGVGASYSEKALKARAGLSFFSNCKKPGRRSETRSDGFVHTICIQFFEANLGSPSRVAVALSVSHTLPSEIFILRAISRRLIPAAYPVLICSQVSLVIFRRIRFRVIVLTLGACTIQVFRQL